MFQKGKSLTSSMVKEMALSLGADLCGIGSMDRFKNAPLNCDPRYLYPEAKSIIGLGFRIHRGVLRPIEEGTHWGMYSSVGYANINDVHMPIVMRELGSYLEDFGYEAVIVNNTAGRYGVNAGVPVREGYPQPSVFLHARIAGVICGMGEIGWSKIFLTPEFGPRQRLAFIITDAELEPDPIMEPYLCDHCKRCVKECPAKAIPLNDGVKVDVDDKQIEFCKLDEERCWVGWQAGNEETNPFLYDGSEEAELCRWMIENVYKDTSKHAQRRTIHSNWAAFEFLYKKHMISRAGMVSFHHPGCICGSACIRTCMIHLEEQGKIKNEFHNKFRIRKPWKLDVEKLTNQIYGDDVEYKRDTKYDYTSNTSK